MVGNEQIENALAAGAALK